MKKNQKKSPRWPDYERVDLGSVITFGTTLFMRKDKRALRIVFPAGDSIMFAPEDEIAAEINIANYERQPTSRLTSLAVKMREKLSEDKTRV